MGMDLDLLARKLAISNALIATQFPGNLENQLENIVHMTAKIVGTQDAIALQLVACLQWMMVDFQWSMNNASPKFLVLVIPKKIGPNVLELFAKMDAVFLTVRLMEVLEMVLPKGHVLMVSCVTVMEHAKKVNCTNHFCIAT